MKSIISTERRCLICGATQPLHEHHIFNGYGLRKKSEEDGLKVYLCAWCHSSVHNHKEQLNFLKKVGERKYLETHSYEEYMKRYKVNYLEEEELEQTMILETLRKIEEMLQK